MTRHLLSLNDLSPAEAQQIVEQAIEFKAMPIPSQPKSLEYQTAVLIFDKPSTRTRSSFASGVAHLGGTPVFIAANESHMDREEPIEDTARVLSSMFSIIIIRTFEQKKLEKLAEYSTIPVINALTDEYHPCQILADIQTFIEHKGSIKGKKVAWVGDGNNVCHSWMNATKLFDFELSIACPDDFKPNVELVDVNNALVTITNDPTEAVKSADLVVTDTWASMGQEEEKNQRMKIFMDYQVNQDLMDKANKDAIFMHCLPAYRGLEVTTDVIDGPQSVIWDEAENRMHAQKSLMHFLLQQNQ